ncbi:chorismate mutase/prephenate dehydratase [Naviculisporaceae sp. PSN 640]
MAASKPRTVAFLGPAASYSHQVTKSAFPETDWELKATTTIRDVFEEVQAGQATYGVVPFENSTHGTVTFTLDCLADRSDTYTDIAVCSEIYLDVHHFLLGKISSSHSSTQNQEDENTTGSGSGSGPGSSTNKPLLSLSHIERVYSHPQAFGQSGVFLRKYLKGVELIDVSSTSKAAELAASDETGTSAAIAGEIAASLKGLDILARSIEDRDDNTTRFFVIYKDDGSPRPELPTSSSFSSSSAVEPKEENDDGNPYGNKYKSLVSFTVEHKTPGALADVLDCFKTLGLNLTSINSLPSLIQPFQYLFFVEFEGGKMDDPEGRLARLEESVQKVAAVRWRWLGSWVNMRRR